MTLHATARRLLLGVPGIGAGAYGLPAGQAPKLRQDPLATPRRRVLNGALVRRGLGSPLSPQNGHRALLQVITDLSGSMWGGNDAAGLRHEALLILAEHLASLARGSRVPWFLQVISFDTDSPFDVGPIPLDRRRVTELARHLLARESGGSSCLGPSLASASASASAWDGPVALCVLSDFELLDNDPASVLRRFVFTPADARVAVVFRSPVPAELDPNAVILRHVDPITDPAESVATFLWDAVRSLAGEVVDPVEASVR
ncbi:MAG: hypothetical protein ACR2KK_03775 [Acidimicrobiales bacterium]